MRLTSQLICQPRPVGELTDEELHRLRPARVDHAQHGGVIDVGQLPHLLVEALAQRGADHPQYHPPSQRDLLGKVDLGEALLGDEALDAKPALENLLSRVPHGRETTRG